MIEILEIETFVAEMHTNKLPVFDARCPKEYQQGHIPGALNLPLLNDEERHVVGITYKEKGNHEAVKKGFDLVGHKFSAYIREAETLAPDRKIMIYCWRGGMRSNIMAWLLNLAGFEVYLLKGGYKSYRRWCNEQFASPGKIIIVSGKTGVGKTEILNQLAQAGEAILDLEGLASHKGSAFGGLGQKSQPSQEQFENDLGWQLSQNKSEYLWAESESRFIGKMRIPDILFDLLCASAMIEITRSTELRAERILSEYGHFSVEALTEKTNSLIKRMGGDRVKICLESLDGGDMMGWVLPLLDYYDKGYAHALSERKGQVLAMYDVDICSVEETTSQLKNLARQYLNTTGKNE